MYHSSSSPVFLSNHVALPYSFRSIRRCLAHTSLRQSPPFTAFIPHRSLCTAHPRNSSARSGSLSVGCRPSCFGPDCLHLSLRSHRYAQQRLPLSLLPCVFRSLRRLPTLMLRVGLPPSLASLSPLRSPAITTVAIAVCVSFSPSITDPHTSGRIIACALYTYTASLCQRSFHKSGERLTHTSFQQSPGLLHSLPDLFLCSFSLAQSLCSLMLRSSTPSFANSHSTAVQWQMLRSVRQVLIYCSQIIKPLPCHLPHSLSNCQFPMPLNKKCATPAGGSRRQAPSCFGLPPSTTLAPLASARASSLRKEKTRHFAPQFFLCSVPAQDCITCSCLHLKPIKKSNNK